MRRDSGPGTNPDFVLAMKYLFDREQMRKSIALGHAVVANDQPIDPTNRFYFAGLPQRPFDPDKAKFHLQKSDVGSAPVPIVASPAATYSVEMALVMQQTAKQHRPEPRRQAHAGRRLLVQPLAEAARWASATSIRAPAPTSC